MSREQTERLEEELRQLRPLLNEAADALAEADHVEAASLVRALTADTVDRARQNVARRARLMGDGALTASLFALFHVGRTAAGAGIDAVSVADTIRYLQQHELDGERPVKVRRGSDSGSVPLGRH